MCTTKVIILYCVEVKSSHKQEHLYIYIQYKATKWDVSIMATLNNILIEFLVIITDNKVHLQS